MFATIEEKVIIGALAALALLVGILGYNHHERKQGAAVCIQQQQSAATAESKKDASDVKDVLADYSQSLNAIPITASHTPMLMCDTPSSMPARTATREVKPGSQSNVGPSVGVLPRDDSRRQDFGPSVQDIALSCMLGTADAQELWNLAIKEAQK